MTAERLGEQDESQATEAQTAQPGDVFEPLAEDATAAAFEVYSYERFLAAAAGKLTLSELARDVRVHIESQLPPARRSPLSAPST